MTTTNDNNSHGYDISELILLPSRQGAVLQTTIYLVLTGSGANAHYSGAICKITETAPEGYQMKDKSSSTAPECYQIKDNSSSTASSGSCVNRPTQVESCASANISNSSNGMTYLTTPISKRKDFSPDSVKPHPKALTRKISSGNRKRRKTCILTDTPEKEALRQEQEKHKSKCKSTQSTTQNTTKRTRVMSKSKKPKQQLSKPKSKLKSKSTPKQDESSDSEDECFCLVCLDNWANSKPKEKWSQCSVCKMWAHDECADTRGMLFYKYDNCNSD